MTGAVDAETRACRLCDATAMLRFTLDLAHGMTGRYFECERCRLLQSDHLDGFDADQLAALYAKAETLELDTGAAWRQYCVVRRLSLLRRWKVIPRRLGDARMLDFGGGSGFIPAFAAFRFGWDSRLLEPYATPAFSPERRLASWDAVRAAGPYRLVVATEVLEHLVDPRGAMEKIRDVLCADEACVYITTGRYLPGTHDETWGYLGPASGQHVCFYARESMERVGELLGMERVMNTGAPYEWLLARGRSGAALARQTLGAWLVSLLAGGGRIDRIE